MRTLGETETDPVLSDLPVLETIRICMLPPPSSTCMCFSLELNAEQADMVPAFLGCYYATF